jgi:hypothetical protein
MEHHLKTWPVYFQPIWDGRKPFELRKNDRDYKIGDTLILEEYHPEGQFYTGRIIKATVPYILEGFIHVLDEHLIMAIDVLERIE